MFFLTVKKSTSKLEAVQIKGIIYKIKELPLVAPVVQDPLPLGHLRPLGVRRESLPREALRGRHHQDLFRV